MKVLVVFDHPRRDSFCGGVLDRFTAGLKAAGHVPEIADLRAEGFDPRLPPADEPDWDDGSKRYSDVVLQEQERISRNEALAFIFPIWWWSFPATTKGWIDRVWNNGWAYGDKKLPHAKALLIGTASGDEAGYLKRHYDEAMRVQLVTGIMHYCGIPDARLEFFYDVMQSADHRADLLKRAEELGRGF
ncbi:NAD(P)H oxidoreductase [Dongia rigui]|uniref:NAD(P)H oxidoreductase n=1 Tax=Dongia rigui TaxID=940149 RepID=A0ABU5E3N4_9PROT|nr:NAD(P)H oxidoreductase [Dongia rigui]MDY0874002.1 NAD(P)H oxidoreductase [Dongia rigui]